MPKLLSFSPYFSLSYTHIPIFLTKIISLITYLASSVIENVNFQCCVDDKTYAIGPKSDIKTFFQKVDEYFMLSLIHHDNITANYPLVLRAFFKEQTNARVFL